MAITTTIIRLLTFRITKEELLAFNLSHLWVGIFGTWIVGMGRYWDDEKATLLQHLGLGSVIYIFLLSAFIWIIVKPFAIEHWNYKSVLTFIALTSFPAIFYAIPVERFMSIYNANMVNVWFLAIVATWRLCLLYYFLKHFAALKVGDVLTVTLMPICLIIAVLTKLNLHRVVFNIMSGIRHETPHDSAYVILIFLTGFSLILTPILLILYGVAIYQSRKKNTP